MAFFCEKLNSYERLKTREVTVGEIKLGYGHPIRIQSMTTTDTMNTEATVAQAIRMIEAGCELVRITAPSIRDAENLKEIKKILRSRGYNTPLVADIHFTPNAALVAARIVEKVRINPGNFADKKKFEIIDYTDTLYQEELEKIREKLLPLIKVCKEYGTALRIGTNHGSLSDRIMSRYGDTPEGMVESALEFVRICRDENFHQIVLSMKSSNPQIMIQSYRLLVKRMKEEGYLYPLHLGVTEAGDGEDGRIKSAVGIGALLEDGIGDTIRVSLTEEPEHEIPVAQKLVQRYPFSFCLPEPSAFPLNPYEYHKRETLSVENIGHTHVPVVIATVPSPVEKPSHLFSYGYSYQPHSDKWLIHDRAADYLYIGNQDISFGCPENLHLIVDYRAYTQYQYDEKKAFPFFKNIAEYINGRKKHPHLNFVAINTDHTDQYPPANVLDKKDIVWVCYSESSHPLKSWRNFSIYLTTHRSLQPFIIRYHSTEKDLETFAMYTASDVGGMLTLGLCNGIWIENPHFSGSTLIRIAFQVLQACRQRISSTEYIACPSCGRTLFNLQETTQKIRKATAHLKGLKIGIMGCIVNGPGEMADADYGYVGSGPGKITLYKGKQIVKKNVPEQEAVKELIEIIKANGDWQEPVISNVPSSPENSA